MLRQTIILQIALKLEGIINHLWRRGREVESEQNERVRTWAGSDVFNELFRILVKMRPLSKLRHVIW